MSNESTQSSRGAEQITVDQLIAATSTSVLRAVKEHGNRPQSPHDVSTTIFIGFILEQ
jgi:hypothetical protein